MRWDILIYHVLLLVLHRSHSAGRSLLITLGSPPRLPGNPPNLVVENTMIDNTVPSVVLALNKVMRAVTTV